MLLVVLQDTKIGSTRTLCLLTAVHILLNLGGRAKQSHHKRKQLLCLNNMRLEIWFLSVSSRGGEELDSLGLNE
jgi:hypothetical protein